MCSRASRTSCSSTSEVLSAQSFLDALPSAVVVIDENVRIVAVNQRAAEFIGYNPSHSLGRPLDGVFRAIFDRFERPQILRRKQLRVDFWFRRPSLSFLTKKFFPSDLVERDRLQGNGTWGSGFGVRVRNAKLETRNSLLGRPGS